MEFKELLDFIKKVDVKLKDAHENYPDTEKRILARTVKLGEEFGEFCDEVLAYNSMQRKDKLDKIEEGNLAEEFADVIFTTLLLADTMNIGIEEAIEKKMKKVNKRYQIN